MLTAGLKPQCSCHWNVQEMRSRSTASTAHAGPSQSTTSALGTDQRPVSRCAAGKMRSTQHTEACVALCPGTAVDSDPDRELCCWQVASYLLKT